MKVYHEIEEMLERELEQIADKRELTSNNLEIMGEAFDIIKDIETIMVMREAGEDGYSNRYPYYMYDDGMDGYSNARRGYVKRDSMGRYSRDDSKEYMVSELDRMEKQATNDEQRRMIRDWKMQLKNA